MSKNSKSTGYLQKLANLAYTSQRPRTGDNALKLEAIIYNLAQFWEMYIGEFCVKGERPMPKKPDAYAAVCESATVVTIGLTAQRKCRYLLITCPQAGLFTEHFGAPATDETAELKRRLAPFIEEMRCAAAKAGETWNR